VYRKSQNGFTLYFTILEASPAVTAIRSTGHFVTLRSNTGRAVVWVIEALCYKPEDRGFDSQCGHRICQIYLILSAALWYYGLLSL
jgi:hypothetical protein